MLAAFTAAKAFAKGISPRTWIIIAITIAIAFAVWRGISWYNTQISDAEKRGVASVEAALALEVQKRTQEGNQLSAEIRRLHDEQNNATSDHADDLRVRGAGKAVCTNASSTSSGGSKSPGGTISVGLPGVQDEERIELIGLPTVEAIEYAEEADLNRNEVLTWRDFYKKLSAAWARDKPKK